MANRFRLSPNQITLLKTANELVRKAQLEGNNHPQYAALDDLQSGIADIIDED